ncbi:cell division protein CrgA [Paenarthrobacter sp. PH39-S1]|uniref:cell division protein CrgA n=1 Tax=Paenarthrobacter sp. PH39-S1 TaxID=3046204 RepID=UPI0024B98716|nr:cell division protein CrgA [Paenarthrobacter sp. PH39-S1]MDJ0355756.1 cell division protein CrgA [Paenarthrobacter sp. PH39-S1]
MPESKSRRQPSRGGQKQPAAKANMPNAVWFKPVMFGLMLIGLFWIIVFYISNGAFPLPNIGNGNILIGFAIAIAGFLMTTRWRS